MCWVRCDRLAVVANQHEYPQQIAGVILKYAVVSGSDSAVADLEIVIDHANIGVGSTASRCSNTSISNSFSWLSVFIQR